MGPIRPRSRRRRVCLPDRFVRRGACPSPCDPRPAQAGRPPARGLKTSENPPKSAYFLDEAYTFAGTGPDGLEPCGNVLFEGIVLGRGLCGWRGLDPLV